MVGTPKKDELGAIKRDLERWAVLLFGFVVLIIAIQLVDSIVFGHALATFGVKPRSTEGLLGILVHPFLHGGLGHVVSNSIAFLVFGWMLMLREEWHFWIVAVVTSLTSGAVIWLVGAADSVHVGASGMIFGLFGYLLLAGVFERKIGSILLSLFVLFSWGSMIFGVLPLQQGISWEGHLGGFLGGALCAWALARIGRRS